MKMYNDLLERIENLGKALGYDMKELLTQLELEIEYRVWRIYSALKHSKSLNKSNLRKISLNLAESQVPLKYLQMSTSQVIIRTSIKKAEKERILSEQNNKCLACGKKIDLGNSIKSGGFNIRRAEADHLFPVNKGGSLIGNFIMLCNNCNNGKSNLVLPTLFSGRYESNYSLNNRGLNKLRWVRFWIDNFTCKSCGKKSNETELVIVSRYPEDLIPKVNWDIDTVLTICTVCYSKYYK